MRAPITTAAGQHAIVVVVAAPVVVEVVAVVAAVLVVVMAETLAGGGQGTLRRRFRERDLRNRVRLKTGTLSGGVRALSGYVENERWGRLVVVILARGVDPTTRMGIVTRLVRLGG